MLDRGKRESAELIEHQALEATNTRMIFERREESRLFFCFGRGGFLKTEAFYQFTADYDLSRHLKGFWVHPLL